MNRTFAVVGAALLLGCFASWADAQSAAAFNPSANPYTGRTQAGVPSDNPYFGSSGSAARTPQRSVGGASPRPMQPNAFTGGSQRPYNPYLESRDTAGDSAGPGVAAFTPTVNPYTGPSDQPPPPPNPYMGGATPRIATPTMAVVSPYTATPGVGGAPAPNPFTGRPTIACQAANPYRPNPTPNNPYTGKPMTPRFSAGRR